MTGTSHARERRRPDPRAGRGEGRPPRRGGGGGSAAAPHRRSRPAAAGRAQPEPSCPASTREKPTEIPWAGWKQILKRAWAENKADNMPIIAGGMAFFGFLSIFPAMIAMLSLYGLGRHPRDRGPAGGGPVRAAARSGRPDHRGAAQRDRRQQRQCAHRRPDRLHSRRTVERVGRRRQPDHCSQPRVRRGRDPQLRQAQADVAGSRAGLNRVRADHLRPRRRRPRRARRPAVRRRRHDPRPGRPLGAPARGLRRGAGRPLPGRSRPRRPPVQVGQPGGRRRDRRLGHREHQITAFSSTTSGPTTRPTAPSPASSC